ncbi:MAG: helix-turn-helix domain-containing protein [Clostridium sp.]|uniref:helix-turn-helix domain-containing protein n=1 Tax=Clostridium sp. TaxID=1506 RepID=UPI002A7F6ECB|nr:helix-turn-helix transcriptional regulator [Clostridium sp.]MCI6692542.1 helix-turn-helix domain-containing protein [Clostridium sp.]MDY4252566.1 helix-turn-helix transcriptional regulator [Clostridium sp.]
MNKLRKIREEKGITKIFVAEKLGISRGRLDRIEGGKAELPARLIPILSELYGIPKLELIKKCEEDYSNGS